MPVNNCRVWAELTPPFSPSLYVVRRGETGKQQRAQGRENILLLHPQLLWSPERRRGRRGEFGDFGGNFLMGNSVISHLSDLQLQWSNYLYNRLAVYVSYVPCSHVTCRRGRTQRELPRFCAGPGFIVHGEQSFSNGKLLGRF